MNNRTFWFTLLACWKKVRGLVVALIVGILGSIGGSYILSADWSNPYSQDSFLIPIITGLTFLNLLALSGIFYWLSKHFSDHPDTSFPRQHTEFNERREHFVNEKSLLAKKLVQKVLPRICKEIRDTDPHCHIRVIIDSGTTLTPVFTDLLDFGSNLAAIAGKVDPSNPNSERILHFYTNNLAGIDRIMNPEMPWHNFTEKDFNLIGGSPLRRYKATTGKATCSAIEEIRKLQGKTIGLITANWILCAKDEIKLCARGRGHKEFKESVINIADYLVIISPLGKIVRINDVKMLNEMLKKYDADENFNSHGEYAEISIPKRLQSETYLLTTRREPKVKTPLRNSESHFFNEVTRPDFKNFRVDPDCPYFRPGASGNEVSAMECPHSWTRSLTKELFQDSSG